jgi:hypothetical protein
VIPFWILDFADAITRRFPPHVLHQAADVRTVRVPTARVTRDDDSGAHQADFGLGKPCYICNLPTRLLCDFVRRIQNPKSKIQNSRPLTPDLLFYLYC